VLASLGHCNARDKLGSPAGGRPVRGERSSGAPSVARAAWSESHQGEIRNEGNVDHGEHRDKRCDL
jgi:hypothetical protein